MPPFLWKLARLNKMHMGLVRTMARDHFAVITLNSIRSNRALRTILVIATMLGWGLLSQRCAFGQLLAAKQAAVAQHECCQKSQPQPSETPRTAECCKVLNVLLPDSAKLPAELDSTQLLLSAEWFVVLHLTLPEQSTTPAAEPPPDVPAFTELVLQRSLLSHAPPQAA